MTDSQHESQWPPRFSWILQLAVAAILGMAMYSKLTGANESVEMFTKLGMEPWGRIGTGLTELAALVLILIPVAIPVGAFLALAVMTGAIGAHLTMLGIVVNDDGGTVFAMALVVWSSSATIIWIRRRRLQMLIARIRGMRPSDTSFPREP